MTHPDPPHAEAAARIRAARGYAGLSQPDLAKRLDLSLATMKRIESGTRPISTDELLAIGQACEVPAAFMREGWAAISVAESSVAERLTEIEATLAEHAATTERIERHYRRLLTGGSADA